jgi:hypothetical protein
VTTADNAVAVDNSGNTKWSKAGYFEYQFLDQKLMYSLIKWAVTLELSVQYWCCFYTAPDATKSSVNNTISKTQYQSFAADVFLIYLLEKRNKMAVTAYSVFTITILDQIICVT